MECPSNIEFDDFVRVNFLTDTAAQILYPSGSNPSMVTPEAIQAYIREKLDCDHLAVEGDGAHFQATIVSVAFAGKSRVQRHQIVYAALGDRMREEIHALSMQTLTPDEWSHHAVKL